MTFRYLFIAGRRFYEIVAKQKSFSYYSAVRVSSSVTFYSFDLLKIPKNPSISSITTPMTGFVLDNNSESFALRTLISSPVYN